MAYTHLAALGARLGARGLEVELTVRGLRVINPQVPECCPRTALAEDTITCRRRPDDHGMPWFWTVRGEPIAPADRGGDAVVATLGNLAHRHSPEGGR
ncbi:hypothetical protein GCM10023085_40440 [Actinomadura viridis]|uniref:Uncharacterized protein n=1 Tax=Actinomadura viridis TaxID=58110 RepID=A0A931GRB9_9ACTN|nr:hypothetical protein [Actinomadura viridis]MBG6092676.1 hypothetical protein [Actinomadura viridis]